MIGVVTALEKEYVAVDAMLNDAADHVIEGVGAGRRYRIGKIPSAAGGQHTVVLALTDIGNNMAALRTSLMLQHFPHIRSIVMVGIAGGVPNPINPDEHVRLGDVVVSDRGGVVQYDFDKEDYDSAKDEPRITYRNPPRPPSAILLEAVRLMQAAQLRGERTWLQNFVRSSYLPNGTRPKSETDRLIDYDGNLIAHPHDLQRIADQPRVFLGVIASANKLLKNPKLRDELRKRFGVRAIEMEGSGIADATWQHEVGYLVVRGICDYCDANKNDAWQGYAAIAAAAYVRGLIASMPTEEAPRIRRVEIIIEQDYSTFNNESQQSLVRVLAALLKTEEDHIQILRVTPGSIAIDLEMPETAAYQLIEMVQRRDVRIQKLKIAKVTLVDEDASKRDSRNGVFFESKSSLKLSKKIKADVLMVSNRTQLARHGKSGLDAFDAELALYKNSLAKDNLGSEILYLDEQGGPELVANEKSICSYLADYRQNIDFDYLLIIGGALSIPFHSIPDATRDDIFIYSDDPYAHFGEENIAVGRLPESIDSPIDYLIKQLRVASKSHIEDHSRDQLRHTAFSTDTWYKQTTEIFPGIRVFLCPPYVLKQDGNYPGQTIQISESMLSEKGITFFNVHGVDREPYWFGEAVHHDKYYWPTMFSPAMVARADLRKNVVFTEASFGANILGKSVNESIALSYINGGCPAFVGPTATVYSSIAKVANGDLLARSFIEHLLSGDRVGDALKKAKIDVSNSGILGEKTALEFLLFGDPSIRL
jgi:nucleoside phosphorylase